MAETEFNVSWKDDNSEVYIYGHTGMRSCNTGYFLIVGFYR